MYPNETEVLKQLNVQVEQKLIRIHKTMRCFSTIVCGFDVFVMIYKWQREKVSGD